MKVLILSTATGQGHNSAGRAVEEYLKARGIDAALFDVLNTGKKKSKLSSKLYNGTVIRVPHVFGMLYRLGEIISSPKQHSPIYYLNSLYAKSLHRMITSFDPQVIVCPHTYAAQAVTRLIEKHGLRIPTVGILTDYTCSPFWEETKLDCYIVANQTVADECVSQGIESDRLIPTGIPVQEQFRTQTTRQKAREIFGVSGAETVFAIMGGSMGYGKIPKLTRELSRLKPDAKIIAVCGTNKSVYRKIRNIPNVSALSYIDNVNTLMDAADVLLTKPGGLSVTEAMTKRIPIVITKPIPGVEVRNSRMLSNLGMAFFTYKASDSAQAACELAEDTDLQTQLTTAQQRLCNMNATRDAGELIIKMATLHAAEKEGESC